MTVQIASMKAATGGSKEDGHKARIESRRCSRGENEGKEESAAAFEREIGTPRDASVSSRHREEIHQNVKHTVTIIKFIYFIIKWHMYKHEMATK